MDNRLPAAPDNWSHPNQIKTESSRPGSEMKDRKLQKADREKLRRGRLNDQFTELGKTLDPERPKFDKATILCDTIQMLIDLTAQVDQLKSEYTTLTEESRELTQEKNDLREEKASLKSNIGNLNLEYQQRVRTMYPWGHMDQSVVMHTPSYPYPFPMQMPMPPMHPYPFLGTRLLSNLGSTFYPPVQYVSSPAVQPSARNKSSEVTTELELKTPGSIGDQDGSAAPSKLKKLGSKESSISDGCSPSGCSSSGTVQVSSSNSVINGTNTNN